MLANARDKCGDLLQFRIFRLDPPEKIPMDQNYLERRQPAKWSSVEIWRSWSTQTRLALGIKQPLCLNLNDVALVKHLKAFKSNI